MRKSCVMYTPFAICAFAFAAGCLPACQAISSESQRSSFASSSRNTGTSATGKPIAGACVSSAGKILYGLGSNVSARGKISSTVRPSSLPRRNVAVSDREARYVSRGEAIGRGENYGRRGRLDKAKAFESSCNPDPASAYSSTSRLSRLNFTHVLRSPTRNLRALQRIGLGSVVRRFVARGAVRMSGRSAAAAAHLGVEHSAPLLSALHAGDLLRQEQRHPEVGAESGARVRRLMADDQ